MRKKNNYKDKIKLQIEEIQEDVKKKEIRAGEIKKQMLLLKEKEDKLEQQIKEKKQLIEQYKCMLVNDTVNEVGISIDDILYALQNKDFLSLQEKIESNSEEMENEQ